MYNLALYKPGEDDIFKFIVNACLIGKSITGDNRQISTKHIKTGQLLYLWTEDEVIESFDTFIDEEGNEHQISTGYNKKVSELTPVPADETPEIETVPAGDITKLIVRRKEIASLSFNQLDTHYDNLESELAGLDLTDQAAIKAFLQDIITDMRKISKVILADIKIADYFKRTRG